MANQTEAMSQMMKPEAEIEVPLLIPPQMELDKDRGVQRNENCDRVFRGAEFIMQSPNYPFPYPADLDCLTRVERLNGNICSLELRFDEFKVEPSEVCEAAGYCPVS